MSPEQHVLHRAATRRPSPVGGDRASSRSPRARVLPPAFDFLNALTKTGVAVCGAGVVQPSGRTESFGSRIDWADLNSRVICGHRKPANFRYC